MKESRTFSRLVKSYLEKDDNFDRILADFRHELRFDDKKVPSVLRINDLSLMRTVIDAAIRYMESSFFGPRMRTKAQAWSDTVRGRDESQQSKRKKAVRGKKAVKAAKGKKASKAKKKAVKKKV